MLASLISLAAFAALSLAAFGLGRLVMRILGLPDDDRLTEAVFAEGLGLVAAGCVLWILGLAGAFSLPIIAILTMVACCWGLVETAALLVRAEKREPDPSGYPPFGEQGAGEPWRAPRWVLGGVFATAAVLAAVALLKALSPPTAEAVLAGPLEHARAFLIDQQATPRPTTSSCEMSLVDLWCAWALILEGIACAQLLAWGFVAILVGAAMAMATPLLGRAWACVSGCLVALTPAISEPLSLSAESLALAAFWTLALTAWWRVVVHGGNERWLVVAGVMAGAALNIEARAVFLVLPLVIHAIWIALRQPERRSVAIRGGAILTAVMLGLGALHGAAALGTISHLRMPDFSRGGRSLVDCVGLASLAALPGLLMARRLRGLGIVVFTALFYTALVWTGDKGDRLQISASPLYCAAAVWVWIEVRRFPPTARWTAALAFAWIIASSAAPLAMRSPDTLWVALGFSDRDAYLLQHDPTYRAALIANRVLRPDAHVLSQDRRTFYFGCRVTWQDADQRLVRAAQSASSVREAVEILRREGYTHVLLAESPSRPKPPSDSAGARLAEGTAVVTDYRFRTAEGGVCRYRLVALR